MINFKYDDAYIKRLNYDINKYFPHLKQIEKSYTTTMVGISRRVMLDRYSQKDTHLKTLVIGDIVLTTIKFDSRFPTTGIGKVIFLNRAKKIVHVKIEAEAIDQIDKNLLLAKTKDVISTTFSLIDKPLELFYEQISFRVAGAVATKEKNFNGIFR